MESIHLAKAEMTPELFLDAAEGSVLIKGKSLMENTLTFYQKIIDWLREYFKSPQPLTLVVLEFDQINSSSFRMISDILFELNKFYIFGNDVRIEWRYYADHKDIEAKGIELDEMLDMPFEYVVLS